MVVHAHPDDEVFGTGGLIARHVDEGDRVAVVYCTSGEAGEIHLPDKSEDEIRPILGELRREEAREALKVLGGAEPYFLRYRDSGMRDTEDNQNPNAFMNAPMDEAAGRLIEIMRETRPEVVVTYDEGGGYGHPDHVMTNRVTHEAFNRGHREPWGPKKLYYSAGSRSQFRKYVEGLRGLGLQIPWLQGDVNFDEYGLPDEDITAFVDISAYAPLKKRALAVHRTQIPSDFFYLSIPDDAISSVGGLEFFHRIVPPHTRGEREADLFEGTAEGEEAVA
jgi:N-acetyl-1-D-myo-inositol-2-amino-2-deoxy-alpha-D-glucopyranoside deacetylase